MFSRFFCALAYGALLSGASASAQPSADLAMNAPDQLAWQLFIQLNSRAEGGGVVLETFATDGDTFQTTPRYPTGRTPSVMRRPILPMVARRAKELPVPALPLATGEETRRNMTSFDFIVQNNLYKRSGLAVAFGKALSFPVGSIEIKANWLPVELIPEFTKNQVTAEQVPHLFHVSSATTGTGVVTYALLSMHIISKSVPNWTWATFEHRFNPGRCDFMGCKDAFGAQAAYVAPKRPPAKHIPIVPSPRRSESSCDGRH